MPVMRCYCYLVLYMLSAVEAAGFVRKTKLGRTNFYINDPLFDLLSR